MNKSKNILHYLSLERRYRLINRSINDWTKFPEQQLLLKEMKEAWSQLTDEEIKYIQDNE